MITFFAIPKAFSGHIGTIQRNAVRSWAKLPGCQIVLLGRDSGVAETAAETGAEHVPEVAVNEFNTPLLDSAFRLARQRARHALLCYVNSDIILFDDFLEAARSVPFDDFLMAGRRWNVKVTEPIDFRNGGWESDLRALVARSGTLYTQYGSDYFLLRRDSALTELPAFAVGRPKWDNWMLYRARSLGLPVVDATAAITAVHQDHDYAHIPQRRGPTWGGPEADRNMVLADGFRQHFGLMDATHVIRKGQVTRALSWPYLRARIYALPVLYPMLQPIWNVLRRVKRALVRPGVQ